MRLLTEAQAAAVSPDKIIEFFSSSIGRRITKADRLIREFKFSILVPASKYYKGGSGDILLQGVIDCCIEEAGQLTVIDYKTDKVTAENQLNRALAYAPQINAYAEALNRITELPVREKLIYFFSTGETVSI
jgi:ATP-dependent helicase/nuclease subunit A